MLTVNWLFVYDSVHCLLFMSTFQPFSVYWPLNFTTYDTALGRIIRKWKLSTTLTPGNPKPQQRLNTPTNKVILQHQYLLSCQCGHTMFWNVTSCCIWDDHMPCQCGQCLYLYSTVVITEITVSVIASIEIQCIIFISVIYFYFLNGTLFPNFY